MAINSRTLIMYRRTPATYMTNPMQNNGIKTQHDNPKKYLCHISSSCMFASDLALVNTSIALLALFAFTVNKAVEEVTYHEQLEKYSCQCEGSDLFAVWLMENV